MQRFFATLLLTGCLVTGLQTVTSAQGGTPGLTIFSGTERGDELNWRMDFGGRARGWDRYRLRIPAKKMKLAVAQFAISYPNYFKGKFDPKDIELRVKDKKVAIQEVKWDKDNYLLEIFPQEPIPAGNKVEIILSNVKNPDFGMYYFNCQVLSPGDAPLLRYLGTWILSIN